MKKLECEHNNDTCSVSINGVNDSNEMPSVVNHPLPAHARCHCCGKNISELKPYDNPEYPKFIGTYLFRTSRSYLPYNEEAERVLNEAEENCKEGQSPRQWLIEKYGEDKGLELNYLGHGSSTVSASWECRDCIILDEKEYFEKLWKSTEDNNNEQ